ncbi:MAG: 6-carboxytetrahydropterin synthase [Acidobacteriota bacterium]|nr:6-carboxytetrahydropterin synthase [Acidobacteriota bacterium]
MTTLTRVYRFAASHRLHLKHLNEAENAALFGKCNNPFGHGHDYVLRVTVTGSVDKRTGLLICTLDLDRLVEQHVLQTFAFRNLNTDVAQFAETVPTTENLAGAIANILKENWSAMETNARVVAVEIQETDRNRVEVSIPAGRAEPVLRLQKESVTANA